MCVMGTLVGGIAVVGGAVNAGDGVGNGERNTAAVSCG